MNQKKALHLTMKSKQSLYGLIFISPFILGTLLLFVFPIYRSFELSFHEFVNITEYKLKFVGLQFYKMAIFENTDFVPMFLDIAQRSLINTPLINIFSIFIAILLNKNMKGRGLFRAFVFLPVILGSGFIMQQLLGQNVDKEAMEVARGILLPEQVRIYIGPEGVNLVQGFLNTITVIMWKSGVQIIIYLAGLQGISASLYEAARVDSATPWEMFWQITLPMLAPSLLLNFIYTFVDSFTDSSNKLVTYILKVGFTDGKFEYSAALSWLYFAFVIVIVAIVFAVMKPFVNRVSEV